MLTNLDPQHLRSCMFLENMLSNNKTSKKTFLSGNNRPFVNSCDAVGKEQNLTTQDCITMDKVVKSRCSVSNVLDGELRYT